MRILVSYASAAGSTRGVAERLAARLAARGHTAECRSVDAKPDPADFDCVVIGSAVHDQAWLPGAMQWLEAHGAALHREPVWAFSVGMPAAVGRPFRRLARFEDSKIIAAVQQCVPLQGHRLFSGVVAATMFSGRGRWAFRLMGCRSGDFRDWPAIDAYADAIADDLQAAGLCG
jgi:menaquinone-dependent protoporphyrinogen oxidase